MNFAGTASADASTQQGTWELATDPLVFGDYVGLRLVPTGTGTSVDVVIPPSPATGSGATVTFDTVTVAGGTQVITGSPTGGVLPDNFKLQPEGTIYNVVSTATFTGNVNVCINYQDKDDDGIVDGTSPPVSETALQLLHDEGGVFVDKTDAVKTDAVANRVCGIVTSLSEFALGAVLPTPTNTSTPTPTATATPTPASTATPRPVGGVGGLGDPGAGTSASSGPDSTSVPIALGAAITAGAVVVAGAAWYARKKWQSQT